MPTERIVALGGVTQANSTRLERFGKGLMAQVFAVLQLF
jgi:hypothetical protein